MFVVDGHDDGILNADCEENEDNSDANEKHDTCLRIGFRKNGTKLSTEQRIRSCQSKLISTALNQNTFWSVKPQHTCAEETDEDSPKKTCFFCTQLTLRQFFSKKIGTQEFFLHPLPLHFWHSTFGTLFASYLCFIWTFHAEDDNSQCSMSIARSHSPDVNIQISQTEDDTWRCFLVTK